jgi:predicted O-methyltransferase YrrM
LVLNQRLFQARQYFRYWLEAMDDHSLHSPFVFRFYREVIRQDKDNPVFEGIENLRKSLLKSKKTVTPLDMGAGSVVSQNKVRKVADIARYGIAHPKTSRLYYRIIEDMQAATVLELGTSLGLNTMYMATPSTVNKVYTIEGCPQIAELAQNHFAGYSQHKIELINQPISTALPYVFCRVSKIDFVLFDAHHTYEATMRYYEACKPYLHEHSVLVFDDIYWSSGMKQAWEEIASEAGVSLSLDLYRMGIVFFKKAMQKEHYVLEW